LNSTKTSDSTSLQQVSAQLRGINSTVQTLSKELVALTPQVPLSTLVIVGNTYDNAFHTFQFTVHNTQGFIVYAQLSATLGGTSCLYNNGQVSIAGLHIQPAIRHRHHSESESWGLSEQSVFRAYSSGGFDDVIHCSRLNISKPDLHIQCHTILHMAVSRANPGHRPLTRR
jgi:hypothetical protein